MNNVLPTLNPILAHWEAILTKKAGVSALFSPSGEALRTFDDLDREAEDFAARFFDFPPGSVLGIKVFNSPEWPALYLAGIKRNLILLPMDASLNAAAGESILRMCGAVGCVILRNKVLEIQHLETKQIDWGCKKPDFLKMTSGTTAAPRVVLFTHEQIIADCDNVCQAMGIESSDINYGVIAFSHSYGFSNLITPLICRGVPLVTASDMMPQAIVEGLQRSQATVFAGIPPLFNALLKLQTALPESLRLLISAGAPLSPDVACSFNAHYGRKIHSFYGSSECGGICYDSTLEPVTNGGFVGNPLPHLTLEKESEGEVEESQYRVRSSAAGLGYFPEEDSETLGNGTFLPADLLKKSKEGYRIVGRLSDLINVGGRKINPAEVEAVIKHYSATEECVVFGVPDAAKNESIHACVVLKSASSEKELRAHCAQELATWQVPQHIHFVDQIPQTAGGKISRRELAKRFL
ncbi:MAG: class I adenylate-forming enzyme family protein [Chthoniobacterales bacterium]